MNTPCRFCNSREHTEAECPRVAPPFEDDRWQPTDVKFNAAALVMVGITCFLMGILTADLPAQVIFSALKVFLKAVFL